MGSLRDTRPTIPLIEADHARRRTPDSETVAANEMFLGRIITLARSPLGHRRAIRVVGQQRSNPSFAEFET